MVVETRIAIETDVAVPMRDGVVLRADVYRPVGVVPLPVLLTRTPYGKAATPLSVESNRALAEQGYIVVAQDVRGRFASAGEFRVNHDDIADGYDSVLWCAALAGSTGDIGMFGVSYMGITQLLAAAQRPTPLKAIFPIQCRASQYERVFYDGAFHLGDRLSWSLMQAIDTASRQGVDVPELRRFGALLVDRMAALAAGDQEQLRRLQADMLAMLEPWLRHLPLADLPVLQGIAPHYFELLERPAYDEAWHALEVTRWFSELDLPCTSVGSWYDLHLIGNLNLYTGLRARARTPRARQAQRLLVGPWTHGQFVTRAGEVDFGPEATIDLVGLQARWFDHWLKGIDTGLQAEPPVRLFVMGANHWRDEQEWPLARTEYVPYYFHSAGSANTLHGDGALGPERPGDEPVDTYVYDPNDPVPTVGGKTLGVDAAPGPWDQRAIEARPDVLCYTTTPLAQDLEVTGPLAVTLYAASSAPDTDWTARLVDVHPDGRALIVQEGIVRASSRVPGAVPSPIRPGEVYEYRIDLWATSLLFLAGHRLRVEISSSNFPHWDRNLNTGLSGIRSSVVAAAQQTVCHDAARASHILLPVIPAA